ncbi:MULTISPECIES: DUF2326 domain-containing protein [unclassified Bradyrhizobium]|uniref:DUF2326 domain-containing protein n=1 Tax=Bradyrhizobium sp. USDA 4541 TaxID=2817704 RepID=UPI0020A43D82|nr:DUF2326 domain-containing protein [Bradyrhizobium sp. USDA 4541]MCP1850138.1 uncharacterized protein YydD (DUF2326 family) [Bradyrhizobium sp. USDA 4541]
MVVATAREVRESDANVVKLSMKSRPWSRNQQPSTRTSGVFLTAITRVKSRRHFLFLRQQSGNFDYTIGLGLPGQTGNTSSQKGTSYKKLVCALFDLALLKVYEDVDFFHFVYHDGIFEALDDRKKLALLEVVREQTATKKTQYIMTLIASDLPRIEEKSPPTFSPDEIILRLHDDGADGLLLKMAEF